MNVSTLRHTVLINFIMIALVIIFYGSILLDVEENHKQIEELKLKHEVSVDGK